MSFIQELNGQRMCRNPGLRSNIFYHTKQISAPRITILLPGYQLQRGSSFLSVLLEAAEGEECRWRVRLCLMRDSGVKLYLTRNLGLLYNKKFTYLSLSYYAIVADLPSVIL